MTILYFVLLAIGAWAAPPLVTDPQQIETEDFIYLRSESCSHIYYIPAGYALEPEKSAVLKSKRGNDNSDRISFRFFLSFKATRTTPTGSEETEVREQFLKSAPQCLGFKLELIPYPSNLVSFEPLKVGRDQEFSTLQIEPVSDNRHVLRLDTNSAQINMEDLMNALDRFQPKIVAHVFADRIVGGSTMIASFTGFANFIKSYWDDRICYKKESWTWWRERRDGGEECTFIPRVAANLKEAMARGIVEFIDEIPQGSAPSLAPSLHARLISRFALSNFESTSVQRLDEMFRVELGNLKKSFSEQYTDTITLKKIESDFIGRSIRIPGIADFVRSQIR